MTTINMKRAAAAIGILVFVAAGAAQAQDPKPFLGAWKGTLSVAGMDLEIGLNFKIDEAKAVQGTFDSITQGAMGLPLGGIEIKDKTITFLIVGVPGDPAFKGVLDAAGKVLAGDFTQGGAAGTFSVQKQ